MELEFPIEFLVFGTPLSLQASGKSKKVWKANVKGASLEVIETPHFASKNQMSVTLFYFPRADAEGDIDNIVKPILDALGKHIYIDDRQIERVLAQRFDPDNIFAFNSPSARLVEALVSARPVLYVKISDKPFEELS